MSHIRVLSQDRYLSQIRVMSLLVMYQFRVLEMEVIFNQIEYFLKNRLDFFFEFLSQIRVLSQIQMFMLGCYLLI